MRPRLVVLGGSGEQGRACFGLELGGASVLLDAGVKRTPAAPAVETYPRLDLLAAPPRAVLLSHAHEDHAAALPLVQEQPGGPVEVYATAATIPAAQAYCRTWQATVVAAGGPPPYDAASVDQIPFRPLAYGQPIAPLAGLTGSFGPAGHLPGSAWILVEAGGRRLLYTADWSSESSLLRAPRFPESVDVVLLDASHGDQELRQSEQATLLLRRIHEVVDGSGSVLLPLPRIGRGQEILLFLAARADRLPPLWAEAALLDGLDAYRGAEDLSSAGRQQLARFDPSSVRPFTDEQRVDLTRPAVVLATNGMLTRPPAAALAARLDGEERSLIVLTGYQAPDTPGRRLLDGGAGLRAEQITWKVHPDVVETCALLAGLRGRPAIYPVHAEPARAEALAAAVRALGYPSRALTVGERVEL